MCLLLMQVVIPCPSSDGPGSDPPGVGLVFLQYEDTTSADKARLALNGRMFGERPVEASIFDQAKFDAQQYE
jgi:splicing factor U2AF subunit